MYPDTPEETGKTEAVSEVVTNSLEDPASYDTTVGSLAAATDIGEGNRTTNQDSVVFHYDNSPEAKPIRFAVIDGIADSKDGLKAAQTAASNFKDVFLEDRPISDALNDTRKNLIDLDGDSLGNAVYLVAEINSKNILRTTQAGDVRLWLIRGGKVEWQTIDENNAAKGQQNKVTNTILDEKPTAKEVQLMPGDRLITATDFLSKSYTNGEIVKHSMGLSASEAIKAPSLPKNCLVKVIKSSP